LLGYLKGAFLFAFLFFCNSIFPSTAISGFIPGELEPILVKGTIKWVKQIENGYFSGIELVKELDEIKLSKLQLCTIRNETEKDDKIKIKIISSGHSIIPQVTKDRFIP